MRLWEFYMKSTKDICVIPFVIMKDNNEVWAKYNISATSRGICHKGVQCDRYPIA